VTVKITLLGTPVGVEAGGSLQQPMATMDIECRVDQIPEEIRIQVNGLNIDDAIHLSEVELPEGSRLLGDPDALVCGVVTIAEEIEAEEGEEGEESAGPEVIGGKPDEDETEE
jgi:large subunit ribosomal protein L25